MHWYTLGSDTIHNVEDNNKIVHGLHSISINFVCTVEPHLSEPPWEQGIGGYGNVPIIETKVNAL